MGFSRYQELYRYVHGVFQDVQAVNVRLVFSINAENVPKDNRFSLCYPGDRFVDYIGLDGYNWGTVQPWSRWRSFEGIFSQVYEEVIRRFRKPVIISEMSSTSAGGDKAGWITNAMQAVQPMTEVKGLIVFNVDKETDWRFWPGTSAGAKLKEGFLNPYFKERFEEMGHEKR